MKRRVRVALFSTGDEIAEPGSALPRAGLYDSNRYLLLNLLAGFGADVSDLGILRDEPAHLTNAITDAARTPRSGADFRRRIDWRGGSRP